MTTVLPALPKCPFCGAPPHAGIGACPMVKSIEYADDGVTVRRVEFVRPMRVDDQAVRRTVKSMLEDFIEAQKKSRIANVSR